MIVFCIFQIDFGDGGGDEGAIDFGNLEEAIDFGAEEPQAEDIDWGGIDGLDEVKVSYIYPDYKSMLQLLEFNSYTAVHTIPCANIGQTVYMKMKSNFCND